MEGGEWGVVLVIPPLKSLPRYGWGVGGMFSNKNV
jgi:hypothetical protein